MNPTPIQPSASPQTTVAQAVALLQQGKLIALPTETVYGIAFNLRSAEARARVKALKHLPENAHPAWVLHLGHPDEALRLLPHLSPLARRFIHKAWPGPIALQFPLSSTDLAHITPYLGDAAPETLTPETPLTHGSSITLRCPEVAITQDILSAAGVPIAIIGASQPGAPPALEAAAIPPALAEYLDAIIDAGPTRYRKPSTLVRIDGDRISVLRPGVIDERIVHRLADLVILFVCSGNTCRSPMAAALAAKLLADKLHTTPDSLHAKNITVLSAGLHASRGMRATLEAVDAALDLGADLSSHLSQPASPDLLRRADLIYTMTQAHRDEILDTLPGAEKKTFRLDPDADIDDPIGMDESVYRQVADHLHDMLQRRLSEIAL